MKKKSLLAIVLAAMPLLAHADTDDFGVWTEIGVEKSFSKKWSLGIEGEMRTGDNSTAMNRLSGGLKAEYKPIKHLKLGAGYTFFSRYSPEKITKEMYDEDGELESYRFTPGYWTPNHRAIAEATATVKLWKWFRISARERYQYTHKSQKTITRTDFEYAEYRYPDGSLVQQWEETQSPKTHAGEDEQVVRSRFQFELDKKYVKWSPFVSVEFHNRIDRRWHLQKLRSAIGTDYKISKHHKVSVAYMITNRFFETPNEIRHTLSLGYKFGF